MNEEFNELFDIKEDNEDKPSVQINNQTIIIHILVRTVILLVAAVASCVLLFVAAYDSQIILGVLAILIVVGWFSLMIMEASKLKKSNKTQLSTANWSIIGLAILMIFTLILSIN
ncbi:hypothetical protein [Epilithonimonas arachidiradicis]|uniref:Uncharacterized protein n=1 Tax=Epilithonimonas arachidiradicis TaxID=1617282 RepID=A0A420CXB1_9FLAO|nr:hypothetical protein [Epilithonimonas arachidiradicis]RKE83119.1 hypothetical protein BXY58_2670 [Epilithonimonas arachidiradicis]GGG65095.1 hypothetical protein GCM10007332_29460 [Epilithonimonas arachidiradicis]